MSDPAQALRDFVPGNEFFIGIDSDGCVFDSMEIKQKECFAPMFVKHHGLQAVPAKQQQRNDDQRHDHHRYNKPGVARVRHDALQ